MAVTTLSQPPASLIDLLSTLTTSLSTAATVEAGTVFDPSSDATKTGISLLTTKNELLLSYLQNLVFLILLKIRTAAGQNTEDDNTSKIGKDVVSKLVELRAYMEKGIRPLEGKLKYQIEKVIRAAEDADRAAARNATKTKSAKAAKTKASHAQDGTGSTDESEGESSEAESQVDEQNLDELSYRPNPSALRLNLQQQPATERSISGGAYKPPRINPVAMPTTTTSDSRTRSPSRAAKSNVMDDYIANELSTAPIAQPSIGSTQTFTSHGRRTVSQRERDEKADRTRYEEENFVRLPGESKSEKRKKNKGGRRGREEGGYGGEEFRGLGEIGDRVSRAVGRKERGGGGGVKDALGRSRKRGFDEGGDAVSTRMGEGFEKRRRILEDRERRKKGR